MARDAGVTVSSARGQRSVALRDFYTGVRRTVMQPDELLTDIAFPAMKAGERGMFIKLALRRGQALSLGGAAVGGTVHNHPDAPPGPSAWRRAPGWLGPWGHGSCAAV